MPAPVITASAITEQAKAGITEAVMAKLATRLSRIEQRLDLLERQQAQAAGGSPD